MLRFSPYQACSDPDGDPLTLIVTEEPAHGTISGPDISGQFIYTPAAGYLGADSFKARVSDGTSESPVVTVSIQVVAAVDDPPACFASVSGSGPPPLPGQPVTVEAGDTSQGTISCSDPEGADLTFTVHDQPDHGTVTDLLENQPFPGSQSARFTYTVATGYSGPDEFTLRVSDGVSTVDAVVRVSVVAPVNDPPACFASVFGAPPGPDGRYRVEAGDATQGAISCSDDEGDQLTFSVFDGPDHGTLGPLQVSPPFGGSRSATMTYTSEAAYRGPDEFTLRVSDGAHDVNALVKLEVIEPVNNPPVCNAALGIPGPDGRFPVEDDGTAAQGSLSCSDDEGADLTFTVQDGPDHGTLSALQEQPSGPGSSFVTFTYKPTAGYRGPDEFTLRASDGTHTVDRVVKVTVIDPINNPPQCFAGLQGAPPVPGGRVEAEAGEPASGTLSCSDDEGADLTFTVHDGPDHGTLSALQEPPGPGSSFVTFTYTPTADYRGPDEFTLRASDGTHTVDQVIRVTVVDPVDNPPQCFAALQGAPPVPGTPLEVEAGVPASGSMSCTDDEGANLAFSVADGPDHGTLSALNKFPGGPGFESAFFTYTPAAAYRGPDEFTLRASDGTNQVERTIQVTVVDPVDEDPECFFDSFVVEQTERVRFDAETGCFDPEDKPLTLNVTDQPDHGPAIVGPDEDGVFTYTAPAAPFTGNDAFVVEVSDGVNTVQHTVNVQVIALVDDPPECFDDSVAVRQPGSVVIEPACFDDEGQTLAYTVTQQPDRGTLTGDPTTRGWTYTPDAGYTGDDAFSYKANDGTADSEIVTVEIEVRPALDTTAPDTTITDGPTGTVTGSTPTFAFSSSEPGSTFECRVDTGAFAACTSPHTTATLADGAHTFQVRAKDPSGNTDQSPASRSFTVATAATGGGQHGRRHRRRIDISAGGSLPGHDRKRQGQVPARSANQEKVRRSQGQEEGPVRQARARARQVQRAQVQDSGPEGKEEVLPAQGEEDRSQQQAVTAKEGRPAKVVAVAIAGTLVATAALGCANSPSTEHRAPPDAAHTAPAKTSSTQASAQPVTATPPVAAATAVLPKANTACLQARVSAAAPPTQPSASARSMAHQPRHLQAPARRNLPLATRTLAALRTLDLPPRARAALARLDSEYVRLFDLYQQAAGPRRLHAPRLAETLGAAEQSVRAHALAAGVPACVP